MSRQQYIGAGIFGGAFFVMVLAVPALATQQDLTPAIVVGIVCLVVMVISLLFGDLQEIAPDAERDYKEDIMVVNNITGREDNPFLALDKTELNFLASVIGPMAAGALVTAAEDTDNAEAMMHEKALRKLTGILTEQIKIRETAEARLLNAISETIQK